MKTPRKTKLSHAEDAQALWDAALKGVQAETFTQRAKRAQALKRQCEARRKKAASLPKRSLDQLCFNQWWRGEKTVEGRTRLVFRIPLLSQMSPEEQKASAWYEACRRRTEVQAAWLKGRCEETWQEFTRLVVDNLPKTWTQLDPLTRDNLVEASYAPFAVPPKGISTFPKDIKKQREVSVQRLYLPATNDPAEAVAFVKHARRFQESGYLAFAVDCKTAKAVQAASEAITSEFVPSIRRQDIEWKGRELKSATVADSEAWETFYEFQPFPLHKRTSNLRGRERISEGQIFKLQRVCREFESFDKALGFGSKFVESVRL